MIVLCLFISPFSSERGAIRNLIAPVEFVDIFVDVRVEIRETRAEAPLRQEPPWAP